MAHSLVAAVTPQVVNTLWTVAGLLTPPTGMPTFNFKLLALGLAAVSFSLIGALMAGAAIFGEQSEKAKRTWLPTTLQGLVLVGVASFIIGILAPQFGN